MRGSGVAPILFVLAASPACWGNEFLTDPDGGLDAALPTRDAIAQINCAHILKCNASGPLCCLSTVTQPSCTNGSCGCATALNCATDDNCAPGLVCCLATVVAGTDCPSSHFVSTCESACAGDAQHLCDPTAPSCATGACASDSTSLGLYGIPPDVGYGVCLP